MDKDCRAEFNKIRSKIQKQWGIIILIFIGVLPWFLIISSIFGDKVASILMIPYAFFYLYSVIKLYFFKCPNCNKSLYSVIEIQHIPILVKTWVSAYCTHCGVRLK